MIWSGGESVELFPLRFDAGDPLRAAAAKGQLSKRKGKLNRQVESVARDGSGPEIHWLVFADQWLDLVDIGFHRTGSSPVRRF